MDDTETETALLYEGDLTTDIVEEKEAEDSKTHGKASVLSEILVTLKSFQQRLDKIEEAQSSSHGPRPLSGTPTGKKRKSDNKNAAPAKNCKSGPASTSDQEGQPDTGSHVDNAVDQMEVDLVAFDQSSDDPPSDDELINDLAESLADESEKGEPVQQKLADILNARFEAKMTNEKLKEKLQKYKIPRNCPNMSVPRTNDPIFNVLKPWGKKTDLRLKNSQTTFSKAAVAVTRTADLLLATRDEVISQGKSLDPKSVSELVAKCVGGLADSLALIGHANKDLSQKRRELHRPALPRNISAICGPQTAMSAEWLYPSGTEFHKALKEAKEVQQLETAMRQNYRDSTDTHQGPRFLGRGKGGWNNRRGRGKFLPRRGSGRKH